MFFEKYSARLVGITAVIVTLAINPWFAYDPINLPKMLALSLGASIMAGVILLNPKKLSRVNKLFLLSSAVFLIAITLSLLINDAPFAQQFFGTWGRSTGYLTYVSFILVSMFLSIYATSEVKTTLRKTLEKLSYFISAYTFLQWADLDPINWSQKLMVATLGNINFMSSFLGLATSSFMVRIFLDKIPFLSKIHFALLSSLNILLITVSGSIQGIAIILTGFWVALTFSIHSRFGKRSALYVSLLTVLCGAMAFVGTLGFGPLSILKQETVLFRADYWRAGWQMTIHNPLFGIGVDSYGDYYRQYRDSLAVDRTGPQRVTNTAHNIFLDVSSGSGIFAGLCFILILAVSIYQFTKKAFHEPIDFDLVAWFAILLGFIVFCLISINQIGVGVWGFVAIGLLIADERNNETLIYELRPSGENRNSNGKVNRSQVPASTIGETRVWPSCIKSGIVAVVAGTIFVTALTPNVIDSKFLAAVKEKDLDGLIELTDAPGAMDFHREVTIRLLSESGRTLDALTLARIGADRNPRYWAFWVAIVFSEGSSEVEKRNAARRLLDLDPSNSATKVELGGLLENLGSKEK